MPKSYGPLDNAILRHHFQALATHNALFNKPPMIGAGDYSTLQTLLTTHPSLNGGKPTIIPTIWRGKKLSNLAAIREAIKSGQQWPTQDNINTPWEQTQDADWHNYIYQMGAPAEPENAFLSDKYRFR